MKFNYLIYKDEKIPVFVKDNKYDTTYFFLHGINSDCFFMNQLLKYENKYNIVSANFPGSTWWKRMAPEEIILEDWISVAETILKEIKSKKIILVAHSMAGGVAVKLAPNKKVNKVIMLSTINPTMEKTKSYSVLKNVIGKNKPTFLGKMVMWGAKFSRNGKRLIDSFSRKGRWYNLLEKYILNPEYMRRLDNDYRKTAEKLIFVIGDKDPIVGTENFVEYGEKLGRPVMKMGSTHSPLKTSPESINAFLNDFGQAKKRNIFQRFITFKNKKYDLSPTNYENEDIDILITAAGEIEE